MSDNFVSSGSSFAVSPRLVVVALDPEGEEPFPIHHHVIHVFVVVECLHVGDVAPNIRATAGNTKIYQIADTDDNSRDCG